MGSLSAEDINAIIGKCLQGEESGYAALYDALASGTYRLCYSLLLNAEDAEDVTQESFVYAFKNLRRFDPSKAAFRTWLYTIAVSRCRNVYRRKRFTLTDLSQMFQLRHSAPDSERPETALAQRDAKEQLEAALLSIAPNLREAVALRYGHGLTYREIAKVMGCPQKTAESRVRLAHKALRKKLQPAGRGLLDELLSI